jgi:hypothetical protein
MRLMRRRSRSRRPRIWACVRSRHRRGRGRPRIGAESRPARGRCGHACTPRRPRGSDVATAPLAGPALRRHDLGPGRDRLPLAAVDDLPPSPAVAVDVGDLVPSPAVLELPVVDPGVLLRADAAGGRAHRYTILRNRTFDAMTMRARNERCRCGHASRSAFLAPAISCFSFVLTPSPIRSGVGWLFWHPPN